MDFSDLEKDLAEKLHSVCNPHPLNDERRSKLHESTELIYSIGCVYVRKAAVTTGMDGKLNFIKAAALLHAARVRCQELLKDEILERNILDALKEMQSILAGKFSCNLTHPLLQISDKVGEDLEEARFKLRRDINELEFLEGSGEDEFERKKERKISKVEELMNSCTNFYIGMMSGLAEECLQVCGQPPCDFAIMGLGSLARSEVTLYSDFEHVIILEDGVQGREDYNNIMEYFRWFSVLFHLIVIGIGETIIPSIGIESLNDFYSDKSKSWFHDAFTPSGVSFDGMMPHACKIPLGRQKPTKKKKHIVELIKPVSQMAEYLTNDEQRINGYCLKDVLTEVCFIIGSKELFTEFKAQRDSILKPQKLQDEITKNKVQFKRASRFPSLEKVNPKNQFYRPLSLLIGYAARKQGIIGKSGFEKASQLTDIPGCEDSKSIEWALAVACEIRMISYEENYSSHSSFSFYSLERFGPECLMNCISVIRCLTRYLGVEVSDIDSDRHIFESEVYRNSFIAMIEDVDDLKVLEQDRYRPITDNILEYSKNRKESDVRYHAVGALLIRDENRRHVALSKAAQDLSDLLEKNNPVMYWLLSQIYFSQGRFKKVGEVADAALQIFPKKEAEMTWFFKIQSNQISARKQWMKPDDFITFCMDGFADTSDVGSKLLFGKVLAVSQCKLGNQIGAKQLLKQLVTFDAAKASTMIDFRDWIEWMYGTLCFQYDKLWLDDALQTWESMDDAAGTGRMGSDIERRARITFIAVGLFLQLSSQSVGRDKQVKFIRKAIEICRRPENLIFISTLYTYILIHVREVVRSDDFEKFRIPELCKILSEVSQSRYVGGAAKTLILEVLVDIYAFLSSRNITLWEIFHYMECSFTVVKVLHPFIRPLSWTIQIKILLKMKKTLNMDRSKHQLNLSHLWKLLFASDHPSGDTIWHFLASVYDHVSMKMHEHFHYKLSALSRTSQPSQGFQDVLVKYMCGNLRSAIKMFWEIVHKETAHTYLQRLSIVFLCNAILWYAFRQLKYRFHYDILHSQLTVVPFRIIITQRNKMIQDYMNKDLCAMHIEETKKREIAIFRSTRKKHFPEWKASGETNPSSTVNLNEISTSSKAGELTSLNPYVRPIGKSTRRKHIENLDIDSKSGGESDEEKELRWITLTVPKADLN